MPLGFLVAKAEAGNSQMHDCLRLPTKHLCSTTFRVTFVLSPRLMQFPDIGAPRKGCPTKVTGNMLMSWLPTMSEPHSNHNPRDFSEPSAPERGWGSARAICPHCPLKSPGPLRRPRWVSFSSPRSHTADLVTS